MSRNRRRAAASQQPTETRARGGRGNGGNAGASNGARTSAQQVGTAAAGTLPPYRERPVAGPAIPGTGQQYSGHGASAAATAVRPTSYGQYGASMGQYPGQYPGRGMAGDNSAPVAAYTPEISGVPNLPGMPGVPGNGSLIFPPGDPIRPIPGLGPRQWNFPVGINISPQPRSTRGTDFSTLRNLARLYEGVNLCRRAIFRILRRSQLVIEPRPEFLRDGEDATSNTWRTPALHMQEWFLEGPDKGSGDLTTWMLKAMGDLLEIDAAGVWPEPTRAGRLYGLRLIAGDTLQVLADAGGWLPRPPAPAYRQVVNGAPGEMFAQATGALDGRELDYLQMTPRTDDLYGDSPVEDIFLRVSTALRKEHYDLVRFTDGATPEGVIQTSSPELKNMTPDELLEWEQLWNGVLAGNSALRVRTKFVPPLFTFTPTRQADIATAFDEFLLRVTVAAFGLTMDELGFTDASGRATGNAQEAVTYRNAVMPYTTFFANYFTHSVIWRYDGQPLSTVGATVSRAASPTKPARGVWDRRFHARWAGIEEPEDWNKKAQTLVSLANSGVIGRTQVKDLLRLPRLPGEEVVPPMITVQGGPQSVVIIPDLLKQRENISDAHEASLKASVASSNSTQAAMEQQQQAVESGQMPGIPGAVAGNGGGSGGGGLPAGASNPVAAQAQAAGKPEAAQQAANGGKSPAAGASAQAAQQVAAKSQAGAKRGEERGDDDDDDDEGGVEYRGRGHTYGLPHPDDGSAAGRDLAGGRSINPLGPVGDLAGRGGADARGDRAGAARGDRGEIQWNPRGDTGEARGAAFRRDGRGGAGDYDRTAEERGGSRNGDVGRDDLRGDGGGRASVGHFVHAAARDRRDDIDREADEDAGTDRRTASPEEVSDEWARYRERAYSAVRRGQRVKAFVSDVLPADLHAWAAGRLATARTRDDVRAIFNEVRAKEAVRQQNDSDEDEHTGMMVALFPSPDAAKRLAIPGGEPADELHITLAFLGDKRQYTSAQIRDLRKLLAGWAAEQPRLAGTVTGTGRFPSKSPGTDEGTYPWYATPEVPHLKAWRAALVKRLDAEGFTVDKTFADYVPHITLAYIPDGEEPPFADVVHVPLAFDRLWLVVGGERYAFALGDEQYPVSETGARAAVPTTPTDNDPLARLAEALAERMDLLNARQRAEQEATLRDLKARVSSALA